MIKLERGTITYTVPRGIGAATSALVEHAAACYGFLLNAPGRRSVAHTWKEFSELIKRAYVPSPARDAVLSALASV